MNWRLAPRTLADPYGHWMRKTGTIPTTGGWQPRVIYTPWGMLARAMTDNAGTTVQALEALFSGASSYRVNLHDLEHWAYCDLRKDQPHFGQGHNELIIFEKANNPSFELPRLLGHALEAATEEQVFGSDAGAVVYSDVPQSLSGNLTTCFAANSGLVASGSMPVLPADTCDKGGPLVVTAIIDHAIPFAHERFRLSADRSRIDAIWLQGTPTAQSNTSPAIGRALTGSSIADLLGQIGGAFRDENELYSSMSSVPMGRDRQAGDTPLQQSFCHGGMMLDLAAGREINDALASKHRILGVELPAQIVAQTNGFLHELFVKSAMNWIWFTARSMYANHPHEVILNYSFGDFCGRRDGLGMLDADFQLRLDRDELAGITVSAGNGFQSDCHAEITASEMAQGQDLTLCLQPGDKTPSFVQFWLDGSHESLPFELEIKPPSTSGIAPIVTSLEDDLELVDPKAGSAVARAYLQQDAPRYAVPDGRTATIRTRVTIAFCRTEAARGQAAAPAGRWGLSFKSRANCDLSAQEKVMLWVERGDSLPGFLPAGRQAYLAHANHQRWDESGRRNTALDGAWSPIKRRNTLSANANAADVLSVAAYRQAGRGQPALYTAAGGGAKSGGPTVAVAIERSDNRRSVLAAGTLSGATRMGNGTSAASAALSRHLAEAVLSGTVPVGSADIVKRLRSHVIDLAEPSKNPARSGAGVLPVLDGCVGIHKSV
ncbi:hypothetical protein C8N36_10398 [Pelagimonas varians]|uniref:Peptidase S8/S53 domain-containing protein n=2 Tax=Pelagimonas varians TaxID=696760 RepID=A0A238KGC4_9RHOB|nr:hypothetical protein C8N36_10398 [Pelagimonas varians]SMX41697.1 hypothetical protein PEV8663_02332 [Pelagimonas varians]